MRYIAHSIGEVSLCQWKQSNLSTNDFLVSMFERINFSIIQVFRAHYSLLGNFSIAIWEQLSSSDSASIGLFIGYMLYGLLIEYEIGIK